MKKFKVNEYIELLKENNLLKEIINCDKILQNEVEYMSYNSKDIKASTLFVCKGAAFKKEYLESSIQNGTFVYVSEIDYNVDIPCILVSDIKIALSILGAKFFDFPAEKLNVIAITGTKGKSTTAYFVKYILDEYSKANNKKDTAIISSIYTYDGKEKYKSKLTTPESFDLQRNLYNAVESGITNVVMEASSQALKYGRVNDVHFNISAFLNISEDHIGPVEHPDFEDYFNSKLKIFEKSNTTCINLDVNYITEILDKAQSSTQNIVTFSTKDSNADIYANNIRKIGLNTAFDCYYNNDKFEVQLAIPGLFNVENALAAISIAKTLNIPQECITNGLKIAKSEGRMEIYHSKDEKILAIVDYAHNRLSFEKIFDTIKKEYSDRKIIAVFGCPGNKAQIRRKDLGEVAGKNADYIYLTEDDPAYEEVLTISKEISEFVSKYTNNYEIIEDRANAIKEAVKKVISEDKKYIILLLGKGNEHTQRVGSGFAEYAGDSEIIMKFISEYDNNVKNTKREIK